MHFCETVNEEMAENERGCTCHASVRLPWEFSYPLALQALISRRLRIDILPPPDAVIDMVFPVAQPMGKTRLD